MSKLLLLIFLFMFSSSLFSQDLKKVGEVDFNDRFMVMSEDNKYISSTRDNAIVHIESGKKYPTEFQFIRFIPNEDKYIGYQKEERTFVEVDIKLGTVDSLLKLDQTIMIRKNVLYTKISPDGRYFGIKCASTQTGRIIHTVLLIDRKEKKEIKQLAIPEGRYSFTFSNDSQKVVYLDWKRQNRETQHFVKEYDIENDKISTTEIFGIKEGMKMSNEFMHITHDANLIFTLGESGDNVYLCKFNFEYEELEISDSFTHTQLKTSTSKVGFDKESNTMIRVGYRFYTFDLETLELVEAQELKYHIYRCVSLDGKFIVSSKNKDSKSCVILSRKSK